MCVGVAYILVIHLAYRGETKVLGVFHDTGVDFNGAVLYRHEAPLWPPLFLRYYDPREWCPSAENAVLDVLAVEI